MTDPHEALAQVREALMTAGPISPNSLVAIIEHVDAQAAEIERLTTTLNTCVWALRQPLDEWKGECERKALDEARDTLGEQHD